MPNYEHKKLIEAITELDEMPMEPSPFAEWLGADAHVGFLRKNADDDELVIHASGRHIFVHTVVVKNERLVPIDQSDLGMC